MQPHGSGSGYMAGPCLALREPLLREIEHPRCYRKLEAVSFFVGLACLARYGWHPVGLLPEALIGRPFTRLAYNPMAVAKPRPGNSISSAKTTTATAPFQPLAAGREVRLLAEPVGANDVAQERGVLLVTGSESGNLLWGRSQIVLDVIGTVVKDPHDDVVPRFFGLTADEFSSARNRSAWCEFERGSISEADLRRTYFLDGRDFNMDALKQTLASGYKLVEGMPELLADLQAVGHKTHAFTNYPEWYTLVEAKLGLEAKHGLQWTCVSCDTGLQKPGRTAYQHLLRRLGTVRKVGASPILIIDSSEENCAAAERVGLTSVRFNGSIHELRERLGDVLGSRKRGTVPAEGWPPRVMR